MNAADPSPAASGALDVPPVRETLPLSPDGDDDAAAALAAAPAAVAGIDTDGRVLWANAACQSLVPGLRLGRPLAESCGLEPGDAARLSVAVDASGETASPTLDHLQTPSGALKACFQTLASGRRLVWLSRVERRRRAEAEQQRLTELLRLACSIGRLGVWERDLVTGEGFWDAQVFRTRGLPGTGGRAPTVDEAVGGIVESDLAAFNAVMQASLRAPPQPVQPTHWRIRYRIRGQDGTLRALHKQWFVQHGADGRALRLVGLVTDDSDAFALLRTRDESLSQLAMAADLTGLAVWRQDLATDRVTLSPQAFAVFDLLPGPDDMPVEDLRALLHPSDRARAERSARIALAGGPPADDELRLRRRNGEWRTLVVRRAVQRDAEGSPQAIVGVAIDVTERIAATRRANELGLRFELATGAAGIGYWTFDARTGATLWSTPLRLMHGLAAEAPAPGLRRWLAECVHPADRPVLRQRIGSWLRRPRGTSVRLDLDVRIRRPDGELRELLVQVVVEGRENGDGNLFGVVLDVTERRLAESARHDRERAVRESEAKSRFLSRMNHELRTPLNAVLGFAQLLLDEEDGAGPAAVRRSQRIAHIRSAGLHLLELINDALDLSSVEGGESRLLRQPVPLAALIAETLPLVETLRMERGVNVDTAGVADGAALADPTRLRQALLNLVSNAVKYNRRGGWVRVEAGVQGTTAVVRVADTGRGMTREQLQHLFEPFNRLGVEHEGIEGSGIGLTIVKSLAERMGGSIRVESEPGVGSVFELHLPSVDAAAAALPSEAAPGAAPRAATAPGAASRTLLYIEDDPVNAMIMDQLLSRRRDLVVHLAVTGLDGFELAQRVRPGLILLDMHLPDIGGLEVLALLRAEPTTAAIPVVGLSANAMREDIDQARSAGIDGYWSKPVDHAAFLSALDAMFVRDPAATTAAGAER